jgi:hypothetical protein
MGTANATTCALCRDGVPVETARGQPACERCATAMREGTDPHALKTSAELGWTPGLWQSLGRLYAFRQRARIAVRP